MKKDKNSLEKFVTVKRVIKIIFLCLLCALPGVFFTACSLFDKADEEDNKTESNTTYTLYVYSVDDSYLRSEKVTRGEEAYVYFGDDRYAFNGYFTEKNGNGNQITDSMGKVLKDFKAPSSSTAFAIYPHVSTITYTLTFETNCNAVVPSETHTADEAFNLPEVNRTGYQFLGWSTRSDDWWGIKNVNEGQYTQNTTLYAVYKAYLSRVTYHKGTNSDYGSLEISYGENYTVPYTEETGYNFVGYYTQQDGQGEKLTDNEGKSVSPWYNTENSVDIYAHYKTAATFTLTCPNDGLVTGVTVTYHDWERINGEPTEHTVFYGDGTTIPYVAPRKRNGYYFEGWYKDSRLNNKFDYNAQEDISDAELELYAKWVEIPYLSKEYPLLSDAVKSGSLRLKSASFNKSDDLRYFCDFNGTFTVEYKVTVKPLLHEEPRGASLSIGVGNRFEAEDGDSGSIEVTVKKGDVFCITGESLDEYQTTTLEYQIGNFPEVTSQKQVKMPTEFTFTVTQGSRYKLPVYEKYNYELVGYFTLPDGEGTQLTDENGNSYTVWTEEDATIYPYYKIKKKSN